MGFWNHTGPRDGCFCDRGYAVKVRWWDIEWILQTEGQGLMVPIKFAVKGSKCLNSSRFVNLKKLGI